MWRQLPLSRNVGSLHLLSVIINPVFLPREAGDSLFCVCMRERAERERTCMQPSLLVLICEDPTHWSFPRMQITCSDASPASTSY